MSWRSQASWCRDWRSVRRLRRAPARIGISWQFLPGARLRQEVVGVGVAVSEITERRRAETALQEHARALAEAARQKDEFLAMLSHELRNPLAPIRTALGLLRRAEPRTRSRATAHDVIDRQVTHMARLLDDLLDVARITSGRINLNLQRCRSARGRQGRDRERRQSRDRSPPRAADVGAARPTSHPRRRDPSGAGRRQPAQQCCEIHERRGNDHAGHHERRAERRGSREGHRHGNPAAAAAQDLRSVHAGRTDARSRAGWAGPRPDAGAAHHRAARRQCRSTQRRPRLRQRVHRPAPASSSGRRRGPRRTRSFHGRLYRHGAVSLWKTTSTPPGCSSSHSPSKDTKCVWPSTVVSAVEAATAFRPDAIILDIGLPRMNGYDAARAIRQLPGLADVHIVARDRLWAGGRPGEEPRGRHRRSLGEAGRHRCPPGSARRPATVKRYKGPVNRAGPQHAGGGSAAASMAARSPDLARRPVSSAAGAPV